MLATVASKVRYGATRCSHKIAAGIDFPVLSRPPDAIVAMKSRPAIVVLTH